MQKQLNQLIEFHTTYKVPYSLVPLPYLPEKIIELRQHLMTDEVNEWADSHGELDMLNRAKELADILYTVFGTIITEGLQNHIERIFDAVHTSNMSKLDDKGQPIFRADGKVLKGPNYKEADLRFLMLELK